MWAAVSSMLCQLTTGCLGVEMALRGTAPVHYANSLGVRTRRCIARACREHECAPWQPAIEEKQGLNCMDPETSHHICKILSRNFVGFFFFFQWKFLFLLMPGQNRASCPLGIYFLVERIQ